MLENLTVWTEAFAGMVWGMPLVAFLVGSGILFSLYFGFPQLRYFGHAIQIIMGKYDNPEDKGEISHFQALCSALSATVGLGNIAGVAVAVAIGGPGAVFWLWVTGFIGMCTKFTEVTLALKYREISDKGTVHGGPMFVIKHGLAKHFYPFAWIYAFFVMLSSFGAGNMFQSNQMAAVIKSTMGLPVWASGIIFCIGAALILVGGIKRIGQVTEKMVPAMVGLYVFGALWILIARYDMIIPMITSIFTAAFSGSAAIGGFVGASMKQGMIMGIRRASFSNEAGMGSAAMAHSAAKSTPIQEGIVALLEPFVDTIVVCSITAIALLLTGAWHAEGVEAGSVMTSYAFESVMGVWGKWIVTATVTLFAFSTLISWSYYGEQGCTFVFGEKWIPTYRYVFIAFIFVGAIAELKIVLNISDAVYGLLAIPNMMACYLLLPKVKELVVDYGQKLKNGEIKRYK